MRQPNRFLLIVGVLLVLCVIGSVFIESQSHWIRSLLDDLLLDNYNHYLPCNQLPTIAEVEQVLALQQETIRAVKAVNPGSVLVRIDEETCPGRADLIIEYPSHEDRIAIERIINGERFYGVPYRLRNY